MGERVATRGARWATAAFIAAALLVGPPARDASAQTCDAGIFASAAQSPSGVSARITRTAPVFSSPTGWALHTCFVLAQHGSATAPVSATIDVRLAGQPTAPFYRLAGAQVFPVGGAPSICQVLPDQVHVSLATTVPLPPLAISQECCVFVRHPTTATCELLPREPDLLHFEIVAPSPPPYVADRVVIDRSRGQVASGKLAFCGMTGFEILGVPLALLAVRTRIRRRGRMPRTKGLDERDGPDARFSWLWLGGGMGGGRVRRRGAPRSADPASGLGADLRPRDLRDDRPGARR